MAIYALADTHLSLSNPEKSMDVFGASWDNYLSRIADNWRATVAPTDTVLISGDISWATYIDKATEDFEFLSQLPGRKIISRGNHDYWWTSIKKMDEYFAAHAFPGIEIVRTNLIESEGCLISGTRGWTIPAGNTINSGSCTDASTTSAALTIALSKDSPNKSQDAKIYERELLRVALCIDEFAKADPDHTRTRILMLHYPPLTADRISTDFTTIIGSNVDICVYGHLHARAHSFAYRGDTINGCRYICTASDYLKFKPALIVPD